MTWGSRICHLITFPWYQYLPCKIAYHNFRITGLCIKETTIYRWFPLNKCQVWEKPFPCDDPIISVGNTGRLVRIGSKLHQTEVFPNWLAFGVTRLKINSEFRYFFRYYFVCCKDQSDIKCWQETVTPSPILVRSFPYPWILSLTYYVLYTHCKSFIISARIILFVIPYTQNRCYLMNLSKTTLNLEHR